MVLLESGDVQAAREALSCAHQLLKAAGRQRQAEGIQAVIDRTAKGEVVKGTAYSYMSPRYNGPE
jgi:hypothetical protein